jgi:hypothetical protein
VTSPEQFRDAWLSLDALDGDRSLERMSLELSVADNPSLASVLADLYAPLQAELDLHLGGESEARHETQASAFGLLVSRTATAVKEIAKSVGGLDRRSASLLVLAPAPGSVRVVFRAPRIVHAQATIPGDADGDSLESIAVQRLAALFAYSEQVPDLESDEVGADDSPLRASVTGLRGPARVAVGQVARTIAEAGWQIDGFLRQQGRPTSPLRLTTGGAIRLREATREAVTERTSEVRNGTIDGHRHSLGAMWFIPETGRPFEAAVGTSKLFDRVASLATPSGQVMRATFAVVSTYSSGDVTSAKRSRELLGIEPATATATADLFEE